MIKLILGLCTKCNSNSTRDEAPGTFDPDPNPAFNYYVKKCVFKWTFDFLFIKLFPLFFFYYFLKTFFSAQGLLSQPDTSVTRDCIAICKQTSSCISFTVGNGLDRANIKRDREKEAKRDMYIYIETALLVRY